MHYAPNIINVIQVNYARNYCPIWLWLKLLSTASWFQGSDVTFGSNPLKISVSLVHTRKHMMILPVSLPPISIFLSCGRLYYLIDFLGGGRIFFCFLSCFINYSCYSYCKKQSSIAIFDSSLNLGRHTTWQCLE